MSHDPRSSISTTTREYSILDGAVRIDDLVEAAYDRTRCRPWP